jgi:hypothetical protein
MWLVGRHCLRACGWGLWVIAGLVAVTCVDLLPAGPFHP